MRQLRTRNQSELSEETPHISEEITETKTGENNKIDDEPSENKVK